MSRVAVIGTTTWGVTLGVVLARNEVEVGLWARTEKEAVSLRNGRYPSDVLSDVVFPPELTVTSSLEEALNGAKAVILAVPSQRMRENIKSAANYLDASILIVSAAKGLEINSNKRMSQVIADEINPSFWPNICVLSGPNLSAEILRGLPAVAVVAAWNELIARKAQKLLNTPSICLYTNSDVIGVELGGALKNIIALGAGIADGLGYGDNTKAALITRGLTEITALGVALGANPLTFSGLTGLGDLIATCASPLSRNHYVGVELTKGRPLEEILKSMDGVAEGVTTTVVAYNLAKLFELEMPITEKIYRVLYEGVDPRQAALELMEAEARHELVGKRWQLFSLFRR
jgi:glycerol-3-phosphate dehydrogenase (NAD(P)+)